MGGSPRKGNEGGAGNERDGEEGKRQRGIEIERKG